MITIAALSNIVTPLTGVRQRSDEGPTGLFIHFYFFPVIARNDAWKTTWSRLLFLLFCLSKRVVSRVTFPLLMAPSLIHTVLLSKEHFAI